MLERTSTPEAISHPSSLYCPDLQRCASSRDPVATSPIRLSGLDSRDGEAHRGDRNKDREREEVWQTRTRYEHIPVFEDLYFISIIICFIREGEKENKHDETMKGEEERSVLGLVEIESVDAGGEIKGANKGTFIGEEGALDKIGCGAVLCCFDQYVSKRGREGGPSRYRYPSESWRRVSAWYLNV